MFFASTTPTLPSRMNSISTARMDFDRWSRFTREDDEGEAYSDYEYDYGDRGSPTEDLEELAHRSRNVLRGLKKNNGDARSSYDYGGSEYASDGYESDYGTVGGPLGRAPSRRFASRASTRRMGSRMSHRRGGGASSRAAAGDLTIPSPVITAGFLGLGAPRSLHSSAGGQSGSMRKLSSSRPSSSASQRSGGRITPSGSIAGPSGGRRGPSRRGGALRKPSLSVAKEEVDEDTFEKSLARMSAGGTWARMSAGGTWARALAAEVAQMPPVPQQPPLPATVASSAIPTAQHSREQSSVGFNSLTDELGGLGDGEMFDVPIREGGAHSLGMLGGSAPTLVHHSPSLSRDDEHVLPPYARSAPRSAERVGLGMAGASQANLNGGVVDDDGAARPASAAAEEAVDESMMAHGMRLVLITIALSLAVFVVAMDVNIVSTAIPHITQDFNSLGDIGWYGSAFLMTTCAFQILFGRIYTHFSPKFVFAAALGIFEVGSLIAALSPNSIVLILGRAVQGIGCAGILSGALIIGSLIVPLSKRSLLGGVIGAMEGVAMITAPVIGGAFTDHLNWRWCFWINLPIGAVVIGIVMLFLRLPPQALPAPDMTIPPHEEEEARSIPPGPTLYQKARFLARKLDLLGTVLLIPSIVSVLLALQWGGKQYEWNSLGVICLFVISVVFLGIFCYFQHQKQDIAMVPPRIFKQRTVLSGFWFMLCTSSALTVMAYFLPLWFQVILQVSPSASGVRMMPMLIGVIITVVLSGGLVSAVGYYAPFMILGTVLMSLGSGLLSSWKPDTANGLLIAFPAIFGAGIGLSFQQPIIAVQTVLRDEDIPIGTSVVVFGQSIGAAIVLTIAETVFSNRLSTNILDNTGVALSTADLTKTSASGVAEMVLKAGGSLAQLTNAYNASITQAFYVSVAMAGLSIIGALTIEWRNVKKEEARRKEEAALAKLEQAAFQARDHGADDDEEEGNEKPSMAYNVDLSHVITTYNQHQEKQQLQLHHQQLDESTQHQQQQQQQFQQPYDQASRTESPHYGLGRTSLQQFNFDPNGVPVHLEIQQTPPQMQMQQRPGPFAVQQMQQQQHPKQREANVGLGLSTAGYYSSSDTSPAPTYYEEAPFHAR